MFTNAPAIINRIKDDLTAAVSPVIDGLRLDLDEAVEVTLQNLPLLSTILVKEDFVYDDSSNSSDKKQLSLKIELRVKGGPASTVCTPIVNLISDTIKADRTLGGLADYVEIGTVQWVSGKLDGGLACAASIDVTVNYFV